MTREAHRPSPATVRTNDRPLPIDGKLPILSSRTTSRQCRGPGRNGLEITLACQHAPLHQFSHRLAFGPPDPFGR